MMTFRQFQAAVVRVLVGLYGVREAEAITWTTNNEARLRAQCDAAMSPHDAADILAKEAGLEVFE